MQSFFYGPNLELQKETELHNWTSVDIVDFGLAYMFIQTEIVAEEVHVRNVNKYCH